MTKSTGWIIIFILLAYIAACVMAIVHFSETVSVAAAENLGKVGGSIGPIEVKKENTVFTVKASQPVALNAWSAVNIDVYDEAGDYLFSFNGDMWHESGYDEGYWEEEVSTVDLDINFTRPGKYTIDVSVESSNVNNVNDLFVSVEERRGSAILFYWMILASFILIFIIFKIKKVEKTPETRPKLGPKSELESKDSDKLKAGTNSVETQLDTTKKSQ